MDRIRSLGVAVLLRHALQEETGFTGYVLKHDAKQRPYLTLPDGTQIPQISLSHAGDYVAVAIDRLPVGIDIDPILICAIPASAWLKYPSSEIVVRSPLPESPHTMLGL